MPWTVDDVDRFHKGLTDKEKRQWVEVANSVLERCLEEGKDQNTCEVLAIKQANGVVGNNSYSLINTNSAYTISVRKHEGEKHLVVPVVMMVEGVHNGSHGPLFHPATELGKFPEVWNGIPVIVSHPQKNGVYVSANSPDIVDEQVIGRVYNTRMEDGKLKAEVWINENKAIKVHPEILGYLHEGKPINVSVGVFTEDELTPGEWNGEKYIGIAKNHRPDHLALLPNEKGACSLEDGCGLGINRKGGDNGVIETYRLSYKGTESTEWSGVTLQDFGVDGRWEDLPREERARIASHFLIGDADAPTFQDLKLPVVNPKTGKLNERALRAVISGRGAMVKGVSAEERKRARRQAYRLLIDEFDADLEIPEMSALKEHVKGGKRMGCPNKVEILVQSGNFVEADREWLTELADEQLDKLIELNKKATQPKEEVGVNREVLINELKEQFKDLNVYLDMAPAEVKEQINFGIKLLNDKKQEYIDYIKTNSASDA
ncbi:MAG TPA: DUF2213 domain-containing protein, partial [Fervidobacterium sp.]|nr:DUF2213 domain-containing protein [Fervidobacterium sp.]